MAAAVLFSLPSPPAHALALGRVTVQSALGEPLRAEIDLPMATPDELATLRAAVASPDAFRAAGMDYSPTLSNVRVTLERRPDGRPFLRLVSDRPVQEPFLDFILETSWASGRIVRDFTMLFDPPAMRQGQQTLTAQVAPAPSAAVPSAVTPRQGRTSSTSSTPARAPAPTASAPSAAAAPAAPGPTASAPTASEERRVTVQAGDTASKIALAHKAETVSLDQMLIAMLRANPDAFVDGNVNRLRAGAVLNMPSTEEAGLVEPGEARRTLIAQSRDFNEFRRRVAESVPSTTADGGTQREARGQVQAQVEEKRPTASASDRLTLSKGAVQGRAGGEDRIARERAAQDAATRVAELNRNLDELSKLSTAAPVAGASAPRGAASGPAASTSTSAATAAAASAPASVGVTLPGAMSAVASAPLAASPASAPSAEGTATAPVAAATASSPSVAASEPAATASAPVDAATAAASAPVGEASAPVDAAAVTAPAPAAAPKPVAAPAPAPEPSILDEVLANPLVPAGVGGAALLLVGLGVYRMRQRRKGTQVDSSFLESRLQPDSFFGASGGQRVDTADAAPTGSSMVYSPSQLDAAGDVDPVAEADVYLAYGRDLQAEEILKEALRINPHRVAIHAKLLEIYAKRRDAKAFEHIAGDAYGLTRGEGSEWARICELGQELDPGNPMYQPGGQPSEATPPAPVAIAATAVSAAAVNAVSVPDLAPQPQVPSSLDLDLDFSLDDAPSAAAPAGDAAPKASAVPPPHAEASAEPPALEMDFGAIAMPQPEAPRVDAFARTLGENSLNFNTDSIELSAAQAPAAAPAPAAAAADAGLMEFDLGSLSLDLGSAAPAPAPAAVAAIAAEPESPSTAGLELGTGGGEDPLATKFALAQEFNAIGDADGARSLAQEVIAEASGDLKSRAQKFLAEIS